MIVYRISSRKYANDLTGEGARLHGGRWNHKLTPCLYAAATRALAILEYSVNVNIDDIPRALSIVSFEIPDDNMLILEQSQLPGDWRQAPAPSSTKDFGTALLKQNQYLAIQIPSVIIPEEYNYLINPLHPEIKNVRIINMKDCAYDVRIKTG
jgi:RES domain-containing protein